MVHFAGLDVSVKETSVGVGDDAGKVILEQRAPTEPADIIALLTSLAVLHNSPNVEGPGHKPPHNARRCASTSALGR